MMSLSPFLILILGLIAVRAAVRFTLCAVKSPQLQGSCTLATEGRKGRAEGTRLGSRHLDHIPAQLLPAFLHLGLWVPQSHLSQQCLKS